MDEGKAIQILNRKEPADLYEVVQPVLRYPGLRRQLVEGSFARNETYRYNCVRVLFRALAQRADLFYPYWERFANMLDSPNGFHRSCAAQAIAHLASVDTDCRLDAIFKHYLDLLDDDKVMVSHYFVETLPLIYQARSDLQQAILKTILNINDTRHPSARKELLKADVIAALDRIFETLSGVDQKRASAFARGQLASRSGKTRKAAREFQKKHKGG